MTNRTANEEDVVHAEAQKAAALVSGPEMRESRNSTNRETDFHTPEYLQRISGELRRVFASPPSAIALLEDGDTIREDDNNIHGRRRCFFDGSNSSREHVNTMIATIHNRGSGTGSSRTPPRPSSCLSRFRTSSADISGSGSSGFKTASESIRLSSSDSDSSKCPYVYVSPCLRRSRSGSSVDCATLYRGSSSSSNGRVRDTAPQTLPLHREWNAVYAERRYTMVGLLGQRQDQVVHATTESQDGRFFDVAEEATGLVLQQRRRCGDERGIEKAVVEHQQQGKVHQQHVQQYRIGQRNLHQIDLESQEPNLTEHEVQQHQEAPWQQREQRGRSPVLQQSQQDSDPSESERQQPVPLADVQNVLLQKGLSCRQEQLPESRLVRGWTVDRSSTASTNWTILTRDSWGNLSRSSFCSKGRFSNAGVVDSASPLKDISRLSSWNRNILQADFPRALAADLLQVNQADGASCWYSAYDSANFSCTEEADYRPQEPAVAITEPGPAAAAPTPVAAAAAAFPATEALEDAKGALEAAGVAALEGTAAMEATPASSMATAVPPETSMAVACEGPALRGRDTTPRATREEVASKYVWGEELASVIAGSAVPDLEKGLGISVKAPAISNVECLKLVTMGELSTRALGDAVTAAHRHANLPVLTDYGTAIHSASPAGASAVEAGLGGPTAIEVATGSTAAFGASSAAWGGTAATVECDLLQGGLAAREAANSCVLIPPSPVMSVQSAASREKLNSSHVRHSDASGLQHRQMHVTTEQQKQKEQQPQEDQVTQQEEETQNMEQWTSHAKQQQKEATQQQANQQQEQQLVQEHTCQQQVEGNLHNTPEHEEQQEPCSVKQRDFSNEDARLVAGVSAAVLHLVRCFSSPAAEGESDCCCSKRKKAERGLLKKPSSSVPNVAENTALAQQTGSALGGAAGGDKATNADEVGGGGLVGATGASAAGTHYGTCRTEITAAMVVTGESLENGSPGSAHQQDNLYRGESSATDTATTEDNDGLCFFCSCFSSKHSMDVYDALLTAGENSDRRSTAGSSACTVSSGSMHGGGHEDNKRRRRGRDRLRPCCCWLRLLRQKDDEPVTNQELSSQCQHPASQTSRYAQLLRHMYSRRHMWQQQDGQQQQYSSQVKDWYQRYWQAYEQQQHNFKQQPCQQSQQQHQQQCPWLSQQQQGGYGHGGGGQEQHDTEGRYPTEDGPLTVFHSVLEPSISLEAYNERLARFAHCSPSCFLLALIYICRLLVSPIAAAAVSSSTAVSNDGLTGSFERCNNLSDNGSSPGSSSTEDSRISATHSVGTHLPEQQQRLQPPQQQRLQPLQQQQGARSGGQQEQAVMKHSHMQTCVQGHRSPQEVLVWKQTHTQGTARTTGMSQQYGELQEPREDVRTPYQRQSELQMHENKLHAQQQNGRGQGKQQQTQQHQTVEQHPSQSQQQAEQQRTRQQHEKEHEHEQQEAHQGRSCGGRRRRRRRVRRRKASRATTAIVVGSSTSGLIGYGEDAKMQWTKKFEGEATTSSVVGGMRSDSDRTKSAAAAGTVESLKAVGASTAANAATAAAAAEAVGVRSAAAQNSDVGCGGEGGSVAGIETAEHVARADPVQMSDCCMWSVMGRYSGSQYVYSMPPDAEVERCRFLPIHAPCSSSNRTDSSLCGSAKWSRSSLTTSCHSNATYSAINTNTSSTSSTSFSKDDAINCCTGSSMQQRTRRRRRRRRSRMRAAQEQQAQQLLEVEWGQQQQQQHWISSEVHGSLAQHQQEGPKQPQMVYQQHQQQPGCSDDQQQLVYVHQEQQRETEPVGETGGYQTQEEVILQEIHYEPVAAGRVAVGQVTGIPCVVEQHRPEHIGLHGVTQREAQGEGRQQQGEDLVSRRDCKQFGTLWLSSQAGRPMRQSEEEPWHQQWQIMSQQQKGGVFVHDQTPQQQQHEELSPLREEEESEQIEVKREDEVLYVPEEDDARRRNSAKIFFRATPFNVHRLLLTAVTVAAKFVDDTYFANSYYARIGGISRPEMNRLEAIFLHILDFRLCVDPEDFELSKRAVLLLGSKVQAAVAARSPREVYESESVPATCIGRVLDTPSPSVGEVSAVSECHLSRAAALEQRSGGGGGAAAAAPSSEAVAATASFSCAFGGDAPLADFLPGDPEALLPAAREHSGCCLADSISEELLDDDNTEHRRATAAAAGTEAEQHQLWETQILHGSSIPGDAGASSGASAASSSAATITRIAKQVAGGQVADQEVAAISDDMLRRLAEVAAAGTGIDSTIKSCIALWVQSRSPDEVASVLFEAWRHRSSIKERRGSGFSNEGGETAMYTEGQEQRKSCNNIPIMSADQVLLACLQANCRTQQLPCSRSRVSSEVASREGVVVGDDAISDNRIYHWKKREYPNVSLNPLQCSRSHVSEAGSSGDYFPTHMQLPIIRQQPQLGQLRHTDQQAIMSSEGMRKTSFSSEEVDHMQERQRDSPLGSDGDINDMNVNSRNICSGDSSSRNSSSSTSCGVWDVHYTNPDEERLTKAMPQNQLNIPVCSNGGVVDEKARTLTQERTQQQQQLWKSTEQLLISQQQGDHAAVKLLPIHSEELLVPQELQQEQQTQEVSREGLEKQPQCGKAVVAMQSEDEQLQEISLEQHDHPEKDLLHKKEGGDVSGHKQQLSKNVVKRDDTGGLQSEEEAREHLVGAVANTRVASATESDTGENRWTVGGGGAAAAGMNRAGGTVSVSSSSRLSSLDVPIVLSGVGETVSAAETTEGKYPRDMVVSQACHLSDRSRSSSSRLCTAAQFHVVVTPIDSPVTGEVPASAACVDPMTFCSSCSTRRCTLNNSSRSSSTKSSSSYASTSARRWGAAAATGPLHLSSNHERLEPGTRTLQKSENFASSEQQSPGQQLLQVLQQYAAIYSPSLVEGILTTTSKTSIQPPSQSVAYSGPFTTSSSSCCYNNINTSDVSFKRKNDIGEGVVSSSSSSRERIVQNTWRMQAAGCSLVQTADEQLPVVGGGGRWNRLRPTSPAAAATPAAVAPLPAATTRGTPQAAITTSSTARPRTTTRGTTSIEQRSGAVAASTAAAANEVVVPREEEAASRGRDDDDEPKEEWVSCGGTTCLSTRELTGYYSVVEDSGLNTDSPTDGAAALASFVAHEII